MTSIEIFIVVASMLGGLALFLFGMDTMSGSLSKLTGGLLEKVIGTITKNRFFAFLFGAGLTAAVQSASAITVLSVGLVNSKIIELGQAIGLLIGANLGTTATAWVLSLNALEGESLLMTLIKPSSFAPFLAIIGVALTMFARSGKKSRGTDAPGLCRDDDRHEPDESGGFAPAGSAGAAGYAGQLFQSDDRLSVCRGLYHADSEFGCHNRYRTGVCAFHGHHLRHLDSADLRRTGGDLHHCAAFLAGDIQQRKTDRADESLL